MSPSDIYDIVTANFAGVLVLVIVMGWLVVTDRLVGGARYREMVELRNYWRDLALHQLREVTPRLERLITDPELEAEPESEVPS